MTDVTSRLTAKNRDQLWNPRLGNRVWAMPFLTLTTNPNLGTDVRDCSFQEVGVRCGGGGKWPITGRRSLDHTALLGLGILRAHVRSFNEHPSVVDDCASSAASSFYDVSC